MRELPIYDTHTKIISFPLVVSEFSCTPALETCDYVILSKSQLKYISMCYIQIKLITKIAKLRHFSLFIELVLLGIVNNIYMYIVAKTKNQPFFLKSVKFDCITPLRQKNFAKWAVIIITIMINLLKQSS